MANAPWLGITVFNLASPVPKILDGNDLEDSLKILWMLWPSCLPHVKSPFCVKIAKELRVKSFDMELLRAEDHCG